MFMHVTEAKYMRDYKVWLAFNSSFGIHLYSKRSITC